MGSEIVRPCWPTAALCVCLHIGMQLGGVALGWKMTSSYLDVVIFVVMLTASCISLAVEVGMSKKRVEGKKESLEDNSVTEAPKTADKTSLWAKLLPCFSALTCMMCAFFLLRVFPFFSEAERLVIRLVGWPCLQLIGNGVLRQAAALGNPSTRASEIHAGTLFMFQALMIVCGRSMLYMVSEPKSNSQHPTSSIVSSSPI